MERLFFCVLLLLLGGCGVMDMVEPTPIPVGQLEMIATTRPLVTPTIAPHQISFSVTPLPTLGMIPTVAPTELVETATAIVSQGQRPMATVDISQMATQTPTATATQLIAIATQPASPTQRPSPTAIPTAHPSPTAPPVITATPSPTLTSSPTPIPVTVQHVANVPNYPLFPRATNRAQLAIQMNDADDALSILVTTVQDANWQGELDCGALIDSFARFSGRFTAYTLSAELQIPYSHYRDAVQIVRQDIKLIYDKCVATDDATLAVWEITPTTLYNRAFTQATNARQTMDDALDWLAGEPSKLSDLFAETRLAIARYGTLINNAAVRHCTDIAATHRTIVFESPHLSPAPGANETAYRHYRASIAAIETDGRELFNFCQNTSGQAASTPVPNSAAFAAKRGFETALHELSAAGVTLSAGGGGVPLAPTSTPEAVRATLIRVQPSEEAHLYEVVIRVQVFAGVPPYTVVVGGFPLAEDGTITISHTCQRDFRDRVTIRDALGQEFRSGVVSAERGNACD